MSGRPRNPERLQQDLIIYMRLRAAEHPDRPGKVFLGGQEVTPAESVRAASEQLSAEWFELGCGVSPESIRARYNKMKRIMNTWPNVPDWVKKTF